MTRSLDRTNLAAAQSGDTRRALEQLRDTLAAQLDADDGPLNAQVAAQYRATLDDLAKLDASTPQVGIQDDLKQRREHRRRTQRQKTS